ncbi:galactosyltransferase-related protein [Longitalea arenae]|uniref:galactosyltransferase-related protein n=1 Tax=Longitalea arenae TaxID=2812558 RepID=UPI0019687190|nr:galactosyltransferase-related protein [Longitalea arenae]
MIFLSAQPDDYYFTWQLELQLYNFNQLGIPAENIHVLIGYDPKKGLQHYFQDLIAQNSDKACFFTYADTRKQNNYLSSIRPHIIQKHLQANPHIEQEAIFYHDADIIFRELPDFEEMVRDEVWYLSDTRAYTGSEFIIQNGGEVTFKAMCAVVGIDPEVVVQNDVNCGGAQYLLKRTTVAFWNKVERDCEALYTLMEDHNHRQAELFYRKFGKPQATFIGVQSWCADMWVVFWNALLQGVQCRIHPDLNFLIAKSPVEEWATTKILHYSGEAVNSPGPLFRKINYRHFVPYYDQELETIDYSKTASFHLVKLIKEYRQKLDEDRIDLRDVTFLIPVRIDGESRLKNLYIVTACLNKYFKTNILIGESDTGSKIDVSQLPACCKCIFIEDSDVFLHRTKVNNILIKNASTEIIAIYDTDVVFPIDQIVQSVQLIRQGSAAMVSPYDGDFVGITNIFKSMMEKILDPELLSLNLKKFHLVSRRSYGGAAFLNRTAYIAAGMENEHFTSWGPEDIERPKRMKNLGYKVKRIQGPLFHLPHARNINSGYPNSDYYVHFMEEYFRISDMNKQQLETYIDTWEWCNLK